MMVASKVGVRTWWGGRQIRHRFTFHAAVRVGVGGRSARLAGGGAGVVRGRFQRHGLRWFRLPWTKEAEAGAVC